MLAFYCLASNFVHCISISVNMDVHILLLIKSTLSFCLQFICVKVYVLKKTNNIVGRNPEGKQTKSIYFYYMYFKMTQARVTWQCVSITITIKSPTLCRAS